MPNGYAHIASTQEPPSQVFTYKCNPHRRLPLKTSLICAFWNNWKNLFFSRAGLWQSGEVAFPFRVCTWNVRENLFILMRTGIEVCRLKRDRRVKYLHWQPSQPPWLSYLYTLNPGCGLLKHQFFSVFESVYNWTIFSSHNYFGLGLRVRPGFLNELSLVFHGALRGSSRNPGAPRSTHENLCTRVVELAIVGLTGPELPRNYKLNLKTEHVERFQSKTPQVGVFNYTRVSLPRHSCEGHKLYWEVGRRPWNRLKTGKTRGKGSIRKG